MADLSGAESVVNSPLSPVRKVAAPRPWPRPAQTARGALPRVFRRPTLLVVGCGDVGMRLLKLLQPRMVHSLRVVAVSRRAEQRDQIRQTGARALHAELDSAKSLERLRAIALWTVHLAPPPASGTQDIHTRNLVCQLANRPPLSTRRWAYVSTTGVYGDRGGALIDETCPVRPDSARAQRRVDAEHWLRRLLAHTGGPSTILRAPGIYALDRLPLQRLRQGLPALRPEDDTFTNHIHADDLARACWLSLFRGKPGRVINAVDQSQLRMGDYFDRVADAAGLPRPPRVSRQELMLDPRVSPMMRSFMSESRRISGERLRRELRMQLRYPTVDHALRLLT